MPCPEKASLQPGVRRALRVSRALETFPGRRGLVPPRLRGARQNTRVGVVRVGSLGDGTECMASMIASLGAANAALHSLSGTTRASGRQKLVRRQLGKGASPLLGCGGALLATIAIALLVYAISGGQCTMIVFP